MNHPTWMIYGANGYSGRQIAREAVARGMRPILAGRSREAVEMLAAELACEHRVFPLDKVAPVAAQLAGLSAVLNCAGPFSATAEAMMDACLRARANYLDITGEIDVIEAAAARHPRAMEAGVSLIPAVGFDVVPSDCLAAMLAQRLPRATHLQLAFSGLSRLSPGTAKTMLENLPRGGRVRIDGRITRVPLAWKTMDVPFHGAAQATMTVPWGDVASAWHTTGIPNIEVFTTPPVSNVATIRRVRWLLPLAGLPPVRALARWAIARYLKGPDPAASAASRASFWGRAWDDHGNSVEATLETPGGYPLTVATALACVERVLAGSAPPGFATPAKAFGADLILSLPETQLRWVGGQ